MSPPHSTRPITDRVKENLFNILGARVVDARVLDLFAGAGSVGIEALSRGAAHATFVEINDAALKTIRENLRLTQLTNRAAVVRQNVFRFLRRTPDAPFDLIYVAPPQYKEMWKETLSLLDARPTWLSSHGSLVVQIHPVEFQELSLQNFELDATRKYGSTLLCFYVPKHRADEPELPTPARDKSRAMRRAV